MKMTLLKYNMTELQPLNVDGIQYNLTFQISSFFGLFKSQKKRVFTVPIHHSIKDYEKHWDDLITFKTLV